MKKTVVTSLLLSVVALSLPCGRTSARELPGGWVPVKEGVSINARTIVFPSADIVSVWVRVVPEETSEMFARVYRELKRKGKDYKTYEYTGFLTEIDCAQHRHREVSILHYNKDRNIIYSAARTNAAWVSAADENYFAPVRDAVCDQGTARLWRD